MLGRVDSCLHSIENVMILSGGIAIFSLMGLAVVSVVGRNFFGQPLLGYIDWIEQVMIPIAFLVIAYVHRSGEHIRMDMFVSRLRGRSLFLVEVIVTIFILLLVLLLVWGSWSHFERSFDFASPLWSRDSSMDISIPIWPAKLLVPISFSLLCCRLCFQVYGYGVSLYMGFVPSNIDFLLRSGDVFEETLEEQGQIKNDRS